VTDGEGKKVRFQGGGEVTREEIIAFISKNQTCFLATVEKGRPHVRGMMIYRADDDGIIIHTGAGKNICRQLGENPAVELCFFSPQERVQVRVSGDAEQVDDMELKSEIVRNRPFMQPWVEERGFGVLAVFRVRNCSAAVWKFETNFEPTMFNPL
jgi:pyridoxamine 5'-phosphate oxidase